MKVMIVDDNNLLQTRITNALIKKDENMCITKAGSCKEAAEMFLQFEPDIVILDIALPDGSGIDLLQQFKKDTPSVHIIILTNYSTDEFKKNCIDMGADYFFDKSNMNELIKTIS